MLEFLLFFLTSGSTPTYVARCLPVRDGHYGTGSRAHTAPSGLSSNGLFTYQQNETLLFLLNEKKM